MKFISPNFCHIGIFELFELHFFIYGSFLDFSCNIFQFDMAKNVLFFLKNEQKICQAQNNLFFLLSFFVIMTRHEVSVLKTIRHVVVKQQLPHSHSSVSAAR